VHAKVKDLNHGILPKGMQIQVFSDRTTLVEHTLATVNHNLLFRRFLVVGGVAVPAQPAVLADRRVVIPIALLTAFIGLQMIHLPANLISMGAVDFGILVDGAVVLAEHILHQAGVEKPADRRAMLRLITHSAVEVARPTFFAMAIIVAALIPVFTLQRVRGASSARCR
jgi:cobalt-zinc-cadmium resistance protein CzcA